jgi:hypothetical protein
MGIGPWRLWVTRTRIQVIRLTKAVRVPGAASRLGSLRTTLAPSGSINRPSARAVVTTEWGSHEQLAICSHGW